MSFHTALSTLLLPDLRCNLIPTHDYYYTFLLGKSTTKNSKLFSLEKLTKMCVSGFVVSITSKNLRDSLGNLNLNCCNYYIGITKTINCNTYKDELHYRQ